MADGVAGDRAGIIGAFFIGLLAYLVLGIGMDGAIIIGIAGVMGMFGDSILGASLEDKWISNEGVNFMATLIGSIIAIGGASLVGIVIL